MRNNNHRLLLLKLDKQISGTIYWPILAAKEAQHLEGAGAVHMPHWMQTSTTRWLCGCVSSFNSRSLWLNAVHWVGIVLSIKTIHHD